jgi:hypothetical protein
MQPKKKKKETHLPYMLTPPHTGKTLEYNAHRSSLHRIGRAPISVLAILPKSNILLKTK